MGPPKTQRHTPVYPLRSPLKTPNPGGKRKNPPGTLAVHLGGVWGRGRPPLKVSSPLETTVPALAANIWRRLFGWEAARRGARQGEKAVGGGGGGKDLRLVSWAVNPSCNWDFSLPNYPRGSGTQGSCPGMRDRRWAGRGRDAFWVFHLFLGITVIYLSSKDTRYPVQEGKKPGPLFPFLPGPFPAISSPVGTKPPPARPGRLPFP